MLFSIGAFAEFLWTTSRENFIAIFLTHCERRSILSFKVAIRLEIAYLLGLRLCRHLNSHP
jgi:hypothetical protein